MTQNAPRAADALTPDNFDMSYVIDPDAVADALLQRVGQLQDQRNLYRRELIQSIEMIVPGDFDEPAIAA